MSALSRINTNVSALKALQNLNSINNQMAMRQLRLTTGKRINDPSDNPAGWTIATKMRTRADGLGQALSNISSSKDMIAVAEGHLQNVQGILEEMRLKAEEAANDTLGDTERTAILNDLKDFNTQIDMEIAQAEWNGMGLLDGNSDFTFQIGAEVATSDKMDFNIAQAVYGGTTVDFAKEGLGVDAESFSANTIVNSLATSGIFSNFGGNIASSAGGFGDDFYGHWEVEMTVDAANTTGAATVTYEVFRNGVEITGLQTTVAATANVTLSNVTLLGNATTLGLGSMSFALSSAVISDMEVGDTFSQGFDAMNAGHSVSGAKNARSFMASVDNAIDKVSQALSYTGAITNRLSYQENSLTTAQTRTEAARSTLEDADMAYEQLESTKLAILQQTATSMLAQANMAPQQVLSLFGG